MSRPTALVLCLIMLAAAPVLAQDPAPRPGAAKDAPGAMQAMMAAFEKASTPGPQHARLARDFVGTWTTAQTIWMDPSAPPLKETGRDISRIEFGGRHVRSDFTGSFMGQPFQGRALTSYDNVTGKYLGSWVDSMSTGQFLAQGDYDAATSTYTLLGAMPDPMQPGATIAVRQVVRIEGPDRHVMEWYEAGDGGERKSMEIVYTRVK